MRTQDTGHLRCPCLGSTPWRVMCTASESSCWSSWLVGNRLTGEDRWRHCSTLFSLTYVLNFHKNILRQLIVAAHTHSQSSEFWTSTCPLNLLQDSAAARAVAGPVGHAAASRHRRAGPDGRPGAAGAVPVEVPLPLRRRHRPVCPGEKSPSAHAALSLSLPPQQM